MAFFKLPPSFVCWKTPPLTHAARFTVSSVASEPKLYVKIRALFGLFVVRASIIGIGSAPVFIPSVMNRTTVLAVEQYKTYINKMLIMLLPEKSCPLQCWVLLSIISNTRMSLTCSCWSGPQHVTRRASRNPERE